MLSSIRDEPGVSAAGITRKAKAAVSGVEWDICDVRVATLCDVSVVM